MKLMCAQNQVDSTVTIVRRKVQFDLTNGRFAPKSLFLRYDLEHSNFSNTVWNFYHLLPIAPYLVPSAEDFNQ